MPKFIFCVPLLFVFYATKINAQVISKIDSLQHLLVAQKEDSLKEKTLANLCYYYWMTNDYEHTMQTALADLALSSRINYRPGKANALLNIGLAYGIKRDRVNELEYFKKGLAYSLEIKDTAQIIKTYDFLTGMYGEGVNDYGKALETAYAAQRLREKKGNKEMLARGYLNLAVIYGTIKSDSEVLINANEALRFYKQIRNISRMAACYGIISNVYYHRQKLSEALDIAFEELSVLNNSNDSIGIAQAYRTISFIYLALGDSAGNGTSFGKEQYRIAKTNMLISLKLERRMQVKGNIAYCYLGLGEVNTRLHHLQPARKYLDSCLYIFQLLGSKQVFLEVYSDLSELDSTNGNFKAAYKNFKLFVKYRDRINVEESAKRAVQAQMQYQFDKTVSVNKTIQAKKDATEKRLRHQQYWVIGALALVIVLVLVIALIQFKNNNQKQKANILIVSQKQQVEKTLADLRAAQAQLIQSEKMASLGELTAGIAHEIQNPLNFVNNFSEVSSELINDMLTELQRGDFTEAGIIAGDVKQNLEKINHHGKRAASIVKGMLQHSRSDAGQKEPADINKLIDEYLRLAYQGFRVKNNSFGALLKTDYDPMIGNITIVSQDIGRVILNLLTNAFYAVVEKNKQQQYAYEPTITVTTRKSAGKIIISVADNGNGIPEKVESKIFQPFFTTKPTGQGTGLGLSLAYDIVKTHGGQISANNKAGQGAEFIIQLPGN